jgi:hypothetical protein
MVQLAGCLGAVGNRFSHLFCSQQRTFDHLHSPSHLHTLHYLSSLSAFTTADPNTLSSLIIVVLLMSSSERSLSRGRGLVRGAASSTLSLEFVF